MKKLSSFLKEGKDKGVVFTFGRFNPATTGHAKLVDKLKKSDPFIIYCFRKWIDLTSKNIVPKKKVLNENNSN